MRVVRIQSRICVGGPALHSILLSEGLSARSGSRFQTVLLGGALEPGEASMEAFALARGVEPITIPSMRRSPHPLYDAMAVAQVTRILRKVRPHVVHTHTAKAGAIGRVAARIARVPLLLHTFHGHVFDGYFSPAKTRAFMAVERALARVTDRILVLSEQQRRDVVHTYRIAKPEQVEVVPLGLDLGPFLAVRPEPGPLRRELGLPPEARIVLGVGRLVPIKRFDLLIEAFIRLAPRSPDAHLVLVGDGELRAALEKQAAGHPRIHFAGLRRDLPAIYADAAALALSSDNEGTPVAVIEAVAAGVPVVATDVGGVRDVLDPEAGTIVRPGDADALSRALNDLLALPWTPKDAQRRDIGTRFSHRRLIGDIEGIYERLARARDLDLGAWVQRSA